MADHPAFEDAVVAWQRSLRAANKSPATVRTYSSAVHALCAFLPDGATPAEVTRREVEDFLLDVVERNSASTAGTHFRGLQQFFRWFAAREETRNPTVGVRAPAVPDKPVPVLQNDQLSAILATVSGESFDQVRDNAILRLFLDAGPRRSELGSIEVDDIDFEQQIIHILGKGRSERVLPFGDRTAEALRRYLAVRSAHPKADTAAGLWLGLRGALTPDGIYQIVVARTQLHPHVFRHTFAHHWRINGGSEGDLMTIAGWKSPRMLSRYGASAATERAVSAHRTNSLGDRL